MIYNMDVLRVNKLVFISSPFYINNNKPFLGGRFIQVSSSRMRISSSRTDSSVQWLLEELNQFIDHRLRNAAILTHLQILGSESEFLLSKLDIMLLEPRTDSNASVRVKRIGSLEWFISEPDITQDCLPRC